MTTLKIGDEIVQIIDWGNKQDQFPGTITEITDKEVVCVFLHDLYRTKRFDKKTGINVLGTDYGWLLEIRGIS